MRALSLVFLMVLAIPACNQSAITTPTSTSTPTPTPTSTIDNWESTTAPITIGDVQVAITQAGVEPIHVGGVQDRTDVFAIRFSVSNTGFAKRFNYTTWAGNAILVDNFGNRYKLLPRPRDMGVQSVPLNPTAPVIDVLLFETPIATAGAVELQLPAGNIGQSGDFVFHIKLHTSGARLDAVTRAAAAAEAEAKAQSDAIAERESQAKRLERAAEDAKAEKARLAEEAKKRADEAEAEKARKAAEAKKRADLEAAEKKRIADREAEIATIKSKLVAAQESKKKAELGLKAAKDSQFASTVKSLEKEVEKLTTECLELEAKLKSLSK